MKSNYKNGQGTIENFSASRQKFYQKGSAQGTIEYLVILAVVVVIGLLLVSLLSSFFTNSSNISKISNNTFSATTSSGISVREVVTDLDGDSAIELQNVTADTITLEKIVVGESQKIFNKKILSGDKKTFSLVNLGDDCICKAGEKTKVCTYELYTISKNGLSKKDVVELNVNCTDNLNISDDVIEEVDITTPVFLLVSPQDNTIINNLDNNVDFNFIITDDSLIASCSFYLDGDLIDTNSDQFISSTFINFDANLFSEGDHNWFVTCLDIYNNSSNIDRNINYTPVYVDELLENNFVFTITVPTFYGPHYTYNIYTSNYYTSLDINWGDGTTTTIDDGSSDWRTHAYFSEGDYNIAMHGTVKQIKFSYWPTVLKDILSPMSNGLTGLTSTNNMFYQHNNLVQPFTAENFLDGVSAGITDMNYMFAYSNFNQDISNWDTSNVVSMEHMFSYNRSFNQDISDWNVSSVTNMDYLFDTSEAFNQDLSDWDVDQVTSYTNYDAGATSWETQNKPNFN